MALAFQRFDMAVDRCGIQPELIADVSYRWGESILFGVFADEAENLGLS